MSDDDSPCNAVSAMLNRLKPDDDAIKLFVGQIPHDASEEGVKSYFEEFGTIHQVSIIRDRSSGTSKGCCFLTFHTRQSALTAMKAVHGVRIMPGGKRPLQIKPAVGAEEKEEDRRLFVGMIGKQTSETELRQMFGVYGNIESSIILRERDGSSRGCAFVTYTARKSAVKAIGALNHARTMEGCHKPLVVKFADTQKDKEMKSDKFGPSYSGQFDMGAGPMQYNVPAPSYTSRNAGGGGGMDSWMPPTNIPPPSMLPPPPVMQQNQTPNLQQLQAQIQGLTALAALASNPVLSAVLNPNLGLLQQLTAGTGLNLGGPGGNSGMSGSDMLNQALSGMQQFNDSYGGSGMSMNPPGGAPNAQYGMGMSGAGMGLGGAGSSFSGAGMGLGGNGMGGMSGSSGMNLGSSQFSQYPAPMSSQSQQQQHSNYSSSHFGSRDAHLKVPEGSNLFLYQLPQEYREQDLELLFSPYGKIVSSKVFVDNITKRSKCYGFVSYDNPTSAQNAIRALNGHVINGRKLRVQLKGPRDGASKPY